MMFNTVCLRLTEHSDKPTGIAEAVAGLRSGQSTADVFVIDSERLGKIPGSPFAYWIGSRVQQLFQVFGAFENEQRIARGGMKTQGDMQFLRLAWEVAPNANKWKPLAKGGAYARYYADIHVVVNWANDGSEIREYYEAISAGASWGGFGRNEDCYFRPGLTWSRRSQIGLSVRALPSGCIFGDMGPAAFVQGDNKDNLLILSALMNSDPFRGLVALQMTFGSYKVGVIQRTAVPDLDNADGNYLHGLALACIEIERDRDSINETSHIFILPALLQVSGETLALRTAVWTQNVSKKDTDLAALQHDVNDVVFRLYGLNEDDRRAIAIGLGNESGPKDEEDDSEPEKEETTEYRDAPGNVRELVAALLSYAIGCMLGRWDVRFATGEFTRPPLPDPFVALSTCSPTMLNSADGLPMHSLPSVYPLRFDADGILADDPDHDDDIVKRVRAVLDLVFRERAESIEHEACQVLGVRDLRDYFRKTGADGFWADHIRRYSKSRRKAPIYWLLQSPRRGYGLWLYYHRLDGDILYKAQINYVEPKLRQVSERLDELRAQRVGATTPRDVRQADRAIEQQDALLADIGEFRDRLERAADLGITPDLNDGVVLTIAPLRELVPWPEAKRYWQELLSGKFEWSSIGKQLRAKGLVK